MSCTQPLSWQGQLCQHFLNTPLIGQLSQVKPNPASQAQQPNPKKSVRDREKATG